MTNRVGKCELCGKHKLTADYGFHGEFICIDCALRDDTTRTYVMNKIAERVGDERMTEMVDDAVATVKGQIRGTRH